MKWLIVRHAEKASDPGGNPGLNTRGLEQAEQLAKALRHGTCPRPALICASPKRRAQETVRPLSQTTSVSITIEDGLDERNNDESFLQFRERLKRFLDEMEKRTKDGDDVVMCSHLDWVEELRTVLPSMEDLTDSRFDSWGTAQVLVLERARHQDPWKVLDFRKY